MNFQEMINEIIIVSNGRSLSDKEIGQILLEIYARDHFKYPSLVVKQHPNVDIKFRAIESFAPPSWTWIGQQVNTVYNTIYNRPFIPYGLIATPWYIGF